MKDKELFIAIDSGGSNTRGLVCTKQGDPLQTYAGPGANPKDIGWEAAYKIIKTCIDSLLEGKHENLTKICITAAGIGNPNAESPKQWAAPLGIDRNKIIIIGDAFAAHLGAFDNSDGIIVVAGTGTALVARKGKTLKRLGGWGHILGDQGSGYALGLAGLRQHVLDSDLGKNTQLTQAAKRIYQHNDTQDLLELIHSSPKAVIAKFAQAVLDLAEQGNTVCQAIVANQLETFPLLFKRFQTLGFPNIVSYTGGLFEHPYYLNSFASMVKESGCDLRKPSRLALDAAMQVALGKLEPVYASL